MFGLAYWGENHWEKREARGSSGWLCSEDEDWFGIGKVTDQEKQVRENKEA